MSFQIHALPAEEFTDLFGQPQAALAARGVLRVVAGKSPGFPCRISLRDAAVGESVLLLNYEHQPAATPYRATHAIFVREGAVQAMPAADEIPLMFRRRLMSVRAYDAAGMMLDADVVEGTQLERPILAMLARPDVACLHLHNAKPGCYAARVTRE